MRVVLPDDFLQKDRREEALRRKTCPHAAVNVAGLNDAEHRILVGLAQRPELCPELSTAFLVDSLEKQSELVAAEPGDDARLGHGATKQVGDDAEQPVAEHVSPLVVHDREPGHVGENDRHGSNPVRVGPEQRLVERGTAREPGQRIDACHCLSMDEHGPVGAAGL